MVKLIYDHRVLDGAFVARRLRDIEDVLNGEVLRELLDGAEPARTPHMAASPALAPRAD